MPGLKGRLSTVVKSKISKQLDRAENPNETLDYAYQRQVENLQNVKKGIADIATAKKRLALQQQQLGNRAPSSTLRRARRCPRDGRILPVRHWSASSRPFRRPARSTSRSRSSSQAGEADRVREALEAKTEQFRSKKEVIKAQYSAAEAQVQFPRPPRESVTRRRISGWRPARPRQDRDDEGSRAGRR